MKEALIDLLKIIGIITITPMLLVTICLLGWAYGEFLSFALFWVFPQ